MLESLRDAFRQAVENFRTELHRDRVPEAADRLLRAMRAELEELEVGIRELERELEHVRDDARREEEAARTCVRREELAGEIGDEETATVAREYARRHLQRHEILTEKGEVLARELDQRRSETAELTARFRAARERRSALAAAAGRADAHDSLRQADDLFAEMDRMAEKIQDLEHAGEAAENLHRSLDPDAPSATPRRPGPEPGPLGETALESRLDELKRRMRDG